MSTDLPSAAALDDSTSPSTSSSVLPEPETSSIDGEDWVVPCSVETGTDVATSVVVDGDAVVERLSDTAATVFGTDDVWTAGEELAEVDTDADSSIADETTSEQVSEYDDFPDFSTGFEVSTAELLFVVPLLVRTEAPDDAVLVIFDVVVATVEQVGAPCEPVADRVVV